MPRLRPSLILALALICSPTLALEEADIAAPEDVAAIPPNAESTDSGLAYRVLDPGEGERHPESDGWVRVHYSGWTTDGEMFDSSVQRGNPLALPLDKVIQGWAEGLQLMVEGETRRLWIPEQLAYAGREGLPQGMLVFDVELINIIDRPATPEHLTAAPPDAEVHKKGLASKVLRSGTGDKSPRATSTVTVNYSGWTTDGAMFDSTVMRGVPATFQLTGVIPGWSQGLKEMVAGEIRRFWIPEKLAYKGDKTKPQGMLIFDVELVAITIY